MKKKDIFILLLIVLSLAAVFFDLFTLNQSFLSGDHREQQYPWAKFYQQEIRAGRLPWWTTHNQCGFPLLAEGQIGAFYPLNYLFLRFLPMKPAYNYEILFHYFLGAFLFYVFLRRKRVSEWGSLFATLIYLYGSAQGGYFYYNLISQRTVIWLPLTLMLIDGLKGKRAFVSAFLLALVFTVQLFSGYLQVAIYSILFSCFYFLCVWMRERSARMLALFTGAGFAALALASVQLLPTYELAMLSSRAGSGKELAYAGSMTPAGFLTLFFPSWDGFLGSEFYVGLLGLFFVMKSLFSKKSVDERIFLGGAVVFVLLALGKFSPLYRALVESTGFGGFRTPIKFLFFVTFSCAVLAGFGFDKWFGGEKSNVEKRGVCFGFAGLAGLMLTVPPLIHRGLILWKPKLYPWFENYVVQSFFGKAGHPHSLEAYRAKAYSFYAGIIQATSFFNKDTLTEYFLLGGAILLVLWMAWKRNLGSAAKLACFAFLFLDLFLYGFTSIKPNYERFDSIDNPRERSTIVEYLKKDPSLFRVTEVYADPAENRKYPVFPDFNMLYSIDDLGMYSPLAMREYKNFLSGWGYVNDSISFDAVKPEKLIERLPYLSFLNVKYILSTQKLDHPALNFLLEENGVLLYGNRDVAPRAFFLKGTQGLESLDVLGGFIPAEISEYGEQKAVIHLDAPEDGILVLTDTFYSGWHARVNGTEAAIARAAKFFRSVEVKKGKSEIVFEYRPEYFGLLKLGKRMIEGARERLR